MTDSTSGSPSEPKIAVEPGETVATPIDGSRKIGVGDASHKPIVPRAKTSNRWRGGRRIALVLTVTSAILFAVGIFAPSFTMIPKLGGGFFERLVRLFVTSDLAPRSFSLVGGIVHLFGDGELLVGGVILAFSVIFPVAKLAALGVSLFAERGSAERHLGLLEHFGKWSMLDVFVVAALVVCFKGFPGGSHVEVEWGIYVFAASVVLSMLATRAMRRYHSGGDDVATH